MKYSLWVLCISRHYFEYKWLGYFFFRVYLLCALFPGDHRQPIGGNRWITCRPSGSILDTHWNGGLIKLNFFGGWRFCGHFSFQASSEQIEAAGAQEIQIEAVQVMVGHQKVSLDHTYKNCILYSFITLLPKVSAVDGYLQDIRVITANKQLLSKVQTWPQLKA